MGLFKNETIRSGWGSPGALKGIADFEATAFGWVDWYNTSRLHSTLGNVPPEAFAAAYCAQEVGEALVDPFGQVVEGPLSGPTAG